SALILQTGNPVVHRTSRGLESALRDRGTSTLFPAAAALDFFVQFADQSKSTYTWSRAMPEAQDAFASESLAMYFGFVNELVEIRNKNPNINLDISVIPQRSVDSPRI